MKKKSRRKRLRKRTRRGGNLSVREQLQDILAITEEPAVRDTLARLRTDTQRILAIPESAPNYIREISRYGLKGDDTLYYIDLPDDVNMKLTNHFFNILRMAGASPQIPDLYNNP
jgi:hypothetical protein